MGEGQWKFHWLLSIVIKNSCTLVRMAKFMLFYLCIGFTQEIKKPLGEPC